MLLSRVSHPSLTEDVLNALKKKSIYSVLDFLKAENGTIEKHTTLTYPVIA